MKLSSINDEELKSQQNWKIKLDRKPIIPQPENSKVN